MKTNPDEPVCCPLTAGRWNPYVVGTGIGLLSILVFWLMYGARLAGGCTSGHGISGSLQLAAGSWTFFIVMFAAGVVTAMLMFKKS